jgi:hypothetical protein
MPVDNIIYTTEDNHCANKKRNEAATAPGKEMNDQAAVIKGVAFMSL